MQIEPALRPLLEKMRGKDGEAVVDMQHRSELADWLRVDLALAGIEREELTIDDETRRRLNYHDLRHTYGTWRAIRGGAGDELTKISRAMGHSSTKMTEHYINEAESFDLQGVGPFPPIPMAR